MKDSQLDSVQLHDLVDISSGSAVIEEVKHILESIDDGFQVSFQEILFKDIEALFQGKYPGYRRSNTGYHDLEHTRAVYLATTRLMHGFVLSGNTLTAHQINLGLAAALFHDVGLIQRDNERKGTGARFTIGHETRSARFASQYLLDHGFSESDTEDCDHIIECTRLDMDFDSISFSSDAVKMLATLVGTADLLAQMADRLYLEKLLLLYQEFQEAKITSFRSELEMLNNTRTFYNNLVVSRFATEFSGADRYESTHFKHRWNINRELYREAIKANLAYLDAILARGEEGYRDLLRRGGIVNGLGARKR